MQFHFKLRDHEVHRIADQNVDVYQFAASVLSLAVEWHDTITPRTERIATFDYVAMSRTSPEHWFSSPRIIEWFKQRQSSNSAFYHPVRYRASAHANATRFRSWF